MEFQRLSLPNVNANKPPGQAKSPKPTRRATAETSSAKGGQYTSEEVLISVSSTVASSNGIDLSGSHLSFVVDDDTGSTVINIVDSENGEVIKQIPSEELLRLRKKMGEIQGLLLDRKI